ncbi:MAG: DNA alkylation repair protein [Nocardioides sp.]|uniref:DNA alkylation repair protein n=1 Tax=Nocardioides sp. TaxID=35761 RepID=UPI003F104C8E
MSPVPPGASALVAEVRALLRGAGDPERAVGQQRYMKSSMPFRGLTRPELTRLLAEPYARTLPDRAAWEQAVRELYDGAEFREERYAAIALLRHRAYRAWRDAEVMGLVEHLMVTGAWWDLVDDTLAVVNERWLAEPAVEGPRMWAWARSEDLWLRRAAILSQLTAKERTDTGLLADVVEANESDPEFFVRKAIGWALRQYARTDADWVRAFVEAHPGLSGLSRREALKHL